MNYKYPDGSISPEKWFEHESSNISPQCLRKKTTESTTEWVARIFSCHGVLPVRYVTSAYDPQTQDLGEASESTVDGWLEVSWPNPVDKTPCWNTSTKEASYISEGVGIPTGYTEIEPPHGLFSVWDETDWDCDMDAFRESKCDSVDALYLSKMADSFAHGGHDFDVDPGSQQLILARSTYALMHGGDSVEYPWTGRYLLWRGYDNIDRTFSTALEFLAFAKAVSNHIETLYGVAISHKDNLRDETGLPEFEDVDSYDYTTGF